MVTKKPPQPTFMTAMAAEDGLRRTPDHGCGIVRSRDGERMAYGRENWIDRDLPENPRGEDFE